MIEVELRFGYADGRDPWQDGDCGEKLSPHFKVGVSAPPLRRQNDCDSLALKTPIYPQKFHKKASGFQFNELEYQQNY